MEKIEIYIKNSARRADLLASIKAIRANTGIRFKVHKEKPRNIPIVSQLPLGRESVEIIQHLKQLVEADAIIRIVGESIIGNITWETIKKTWPTFIKFISLNNKQRGNMWGAKVEIKRQIAPEITQTLHFFLDNIPELKIFEAISKAQPKLKNLDETLGEMYVKKIKHVAFTFDIENNDWKIIGIEKIDGGVENLLEMKQ